MRLNVSIAGSLLGPITASLRAAAEGGGGGVIQTIAVGQNVHGDIAAFGLFDSLLVTGAVVRASPTATVPLI